MPIYILLPLFAAVAYSIGGLFNKQAMAGGCGLYRVATFTAWATALMLLPLSALESGPLPLHLWIQPLAASVCFASGTLFLMLALRIGDLSLVAPLSGIKPVMNALLVTVLLGTPVLPATWIACFLTALALLVLRTPNRTTGHSFRITAAVTFLSVSFFALCDTCFQHWAANWGVFRFGALTFMIASIAALALIPLFGSPWKKLNRTAQIHALTGAFFCALPGLCMSYTLGTFGHAPEANIVYSTRAIISILLVRFASRHIGSSERHMSRAVLIRRIMGTVVLTGAIALMLLGSAP
jgi:uncharacterized membrane protein